MIEFWQKLKVNYKTIFEDREATQLLESLISEAVQRPDSAVKGSIFTISY